MKKSLLVLGMMVMVLPGVVVAGQPTAEERAAIKASKQAQIQAMKEEAKKQKAAEIAKYKEGLSKIKDERKKQQLEQFRVRWCDLNRKRVESGLAGLNRMGEILLKVEAKAGVAKTNGKDIATVTAAITAAKTRIEEAKTAVSAQSQMDCSALAISTEKNLGQDVKNQVSNLERTWNEINQKVKIARKAVSDSIVALAKITGETIPAGKQ